MKKNIKSNLFWFLLGSIMFGTISVSASYLYNSESVLYNNENVKVAIDDLYDKASNSQSISSIAKDANGNNAEVHYYGGRISSVTKSFTMNKGKYLMFVYTTYNRWWDGTNVGGDTTNQTVVTLSNGTATKINDYAYIIDVTADNTPVNIKIVSYGTDENQRTIYEICFYE